MRTLAPVSLDPGYQAARTAAAWHRVPQPGTLLLGGATRGEYLQRQTTNDLDLLAANRALPNILTNASGRILEVFTLLQLGEQIALLTQPGHAPGLAAYFKKNVFFNDQVTVEDASAAWAQLELYGPLAAAALAALGIANQPALDELVTGSLDGAEFYAIGEDSTIRLLLPSAVADASIDRLVDAPFPLLTQEACELLRIEAGRAGHPEFTDAYTPYEVGLDRCVSASKGCYTGQEVLARQVTYDKVTRGLVQLAGDAPVAPGSAVSLDGRIAGKVSSAAVSPAHGALALAVLRKPFQPGQQALVGENGIRATIR